MCIYIYGVLGSGRGGGPYPQIVRSKPNSQVYSEVPGHEIHPAAAEEGADEGATFALVMYRVMRPVIKSI